MARVSPSSRLAVAVLTATVAAGWGCGSRRPRLPEPLRVGPLPDGTLGAFVENLVAGRSATLDLDLPERGGRKTFTFIVVNGPAPASLTANLVFARGTTEPGGPTARIMVVDERTLELAVFGAGTVHISQVLANKSFDYLLVEATYRSGTPCSVGQEADATERALASANRVEGGEAPRQLRMAVAVSPKMRSEVYGGNVTVINRDAVKTLFYANEIMTRDLGVELVLWGPVLKADTINTDGTKGLKRLSQHIVRLMGESTIEQPADLGHLFETGSGGSALVGSVCVPDAKAGAHSGTSSLMPFALNNFIHEVGHQLGAPHSFNAKSPDRHGRGAFEPGLGASIMSYAKEQRQTYFHVSSMGFVANALAQGPASYRGCGLTTPAMPVVPDVILEKDEWPVPPDTPFELEVVRNASVETYRWDAYDRGSTPDGTPPFFASNPTRQPSRIYPSLGDLVARDRPPIEWPTGRARFRVLGFSRDGTRRYRDLDVRVQRGAPFAITKVECVSPCASGSMLKTAWEQAGTRQQPYEIETLRAEIVEVVGGRPVVRHPIGTASSLPNRGYAEIELPANLSPMADARLILRANGGIFLALSEPFAIGAPPPAQPGR